MGAVTRNADGTRALTDSIRRDLEIRYNLTVPEAERLFHLIEAGEDEAASALSIKNERKVFRVHVERGYSPESDPRLVAERRRAEEEANKPEPREPAAEPVKQGSVTRSSNIRGRA